MFQIPPNTTSCKEQKQPFIVAQKEMFFEIVCIPQVGIKRKKDSVNANSVQIPQSEQSVLETQWRGERREEGGVGVGDTNAVSHFLCYVTAVKAGRRGRPAPRNPGKLASCLSPP